MLAFLPDGGLAPVLARGLAVAGLFAVFGAMLAQVAVMPPVLALLAPVEAARLDRRWRWLVGGGVLLALVGLAGWSWFIAGTLADPGASPLTTLPTLLRYTMFGHATLLQLVGLALAALASAGRRHRLAAGLAGGAVVLQAAHGHAAAMGAVGSTISTVLHLLAGSAWLGGLPPLLLVVASANPRAAWRGCRAFAPLGTACVLLLAGTASWQAWALIGGLPGLVGTAYGRVALVKLALFTLLLGFAARHRFRLTPDLLMDDGARRAPAATRLAKGHTSAKGHMIASLAGETAVGCLVVLAAGLLSSLPPAMHVSPIWPFPWRPSLATIHDDPDFRREVIAALLALAAAVLLAVASVGLRPRLRWPGLAAALGIAWLAVPHLDLLLVPAYPTSYDRSPTGFAAVSIAQGGALFPQHCASCHGVSGRGDGPRRGSAGASGLPIPPADLTAGHLWMHSDGELFWWLAHGIAAPDGSLAMPGTAASLSDDERWSLIDYIRAHNAGLARRGGGQWPVPLQAPSFQAMCAGGQSVDLPDWRGQVVRVVLDGPTSVRAGPAGLGSPMPACRIEDADVARAYAELAGLALPQAAGTQFLIDGQGWLRDVQPAGAVPGWDDPAVLARAVAAIRAQPMAGPEDAHAHMAM